MKVAANNITPPAKIHGFKNLLAPWPIKAPATGLPMSAPNELMVKASPIRALTSDGLLDSAITVAGGKETSPPEAKPYMQAKTIVHIFPGAATHDRTVAPAMKQ